MLSESLRQALVFVLWLTVGTLPIGIALLFGLAVVARRMDDAHVQLGRLNGTWEDDD
jgi:hypothetical protein